MAEEEDEDASDLLKALKCGEVTREDDTGRYKCDVCNKQLSSKATIKAHLKTKTHLNKATLGDGLEQIDLNEDILYCRFCRVYLQRNQVEDHRKTEKHMILARTMKTFSRNPHERDTMYPACSTQPWGQVHVFNYTDTRDGSEKDSENLKKSFTNLGYNVVIYENLTAQETHGKIDHIRGDETLKKAESIFLIFLAHGDTTDKFICADRKTISLDDVKVQLTDNMCPLMKNKPKIILTNYCRGEIKEQEVDGISIPNDIVIIHASKEGVQAVRNVKSGTYFVICLCQILQKLEAPTDLREVYYSLVYEMKKIGVSSPMWRDWSFKKYVVKKITNGKHPHEPQSR